jgi:hypothetical protein
MRFRLATVPGKAMGVTSCARDSGVSSGSGIEQGIITSSLRTLGAACAVLKSNQLQTKCQQLICESASHLSTVAQTGLHHLLRTTGRGGAAVNRNGSVARHIIDTGHNVDNASSIGLKDGTCFPIAGARLRRGESGVLCPVWLNGEQHRQPIHWLTLRITDTHNQCGRLGKSPDRTKPDQRVGDM